MASEITNYKCPACTAPLHFSEKTGKLECDFCGSSFSAEEIEAQYAQKNQAAEAASAQREAAPQEDIPHDWAEDSDSVRAYRCPSCSAELVLDVTTAATSCPYCGNPTIVPGQLAGSRKPDYVIPFKMDKEAAVAALKKHYRGKPLLPRAFSDANHIQEIKGVYVPFWLFDFRMNGKASYLATRVMSTTTAAEIVTTTDHFVVHREGSMAFQRVPTDASRSMPDAHMDAIEPYDYNALKPFSLSYLPGFLANKYDVTKEESTERAANRCRNTVGDALRDSVSGYNTCTKSEERISVAASSVKYALLPVWLLSTQWNGQNYLFAMNGQTGKLIGDLPIDKKRLVGWCAGAFVLGTALLGWLFL